MYDRLIWDLNMHQEKKIAYGKFFDFRAQKCIYRIRFQEIKIGALECFEKIRAFLTFPDEKLTFQWSKVV